MRVLLITLLLFLFLPRTVSAVTVTISNTPSEISDQSFSFNASITGASAGTNYLRANFFPTATTNYFGYTYNNSSFVNSSTCSDYFAVTIDSTGNWSGTVQAKIDTSSNYYSGSGNYGFKVRRYTQSCSSYIWSNEITINASIASPSPSTSPSSSSSSSTSSSFTVSNVPAEINSDKSFSAHIAISLPNNSNTTYYLKGAFKKSDSSNYFGETKVGGIWVKNGSNYSDQINITTDSSGNWSGDIEVRPDILDSGYDGAGKYIFKVAKYSSTGALTWSDEKDIQIAAKEVSLDDTKEMPETKITGNSNAKLPDSVYSLENYRKAATVAGAKTENSPSPKVSVAGQEFKSPFIFLGFGFLVLGLVSIGYIIFRKWKAT